LIFHGLHFYCHCRLTLNFRFSLFYFLHFRYFWFLLVFDNNGYFFGSDVVAAAEACRDAGAKLISMSLGGPSYDGDEKRIFENLFDQGILSIAAAGNDGVDDYSFPASYEKVMSVAAVNSNKNHASFSQYNDRVDIAAPGVNVRSTWNNGRYSSISGTSMGKFVGSWATVIIFLHIIYLSHSSPLWSTEYYSYPTRLWRCCTVA
jgi:subtilisin family serine protease